MNLLDSVYRAAQNFLVQTQPYSKKSKNKKVTIDSNAERHRVIFTSSSKSETLIQYVKKQLKLSQLKIEPKPILSFDTEEGKLWILQTANYNKDVIVDQHENKLSPSDFGVSRDLAGQWCRSTKPKGAVDFVFLSASDEEIRGALTGLGLASYNFLDCIKGTENSTVWSFSKSKAKLSPKLIEEAYSLFSSMNVSRHLSNLPASVATPQGIAEGMRDFFANHKNLKVKILDAKDLKKLGMGLLLGTGQGSVNEPRLLRISYQPKAARAKSTMAFVGKGVTFDSGGLDIKPASGMRLMKKDMSGAATMIGIAHFLALKKLKVACEFYLPLAENSVSGQAMRPGDVLVSHAGHLVEIDNTDAEGRLVMADAISLALKEQKPSLLIDVSTLTGAMRVALGLDVAGFFSNDDSLAKSLEQSAQKMGEPAWRMPLMSKYWSQLSSPYADFKNSSESGFGGAITAALFLEKFVGQTSWAHFDVMSWNLSAQGAMSEGGNAQALQIIAKFLESKSK